MSEVLIPNDVFFSNVIELLDSGVKVTFVVKGHSMTPFLRNGMDKVCISRFDPDRDVLKKGHVALFRYHGNYILHRVVAVEHIDMKGPPLYVFQGDGNLKGREYALPSDIFGVMECRISPSGKEWNCSSLSWRVLSCLWKAAAPFRRILLALIRRVNMIRIAG